MGAIIKISSPPTFNWLKKFLELKCDSLKVFEEPQSGKSVVTNKTGPNQCPLNK